MKLTKAQERVLRELAFDDYRARREDMNWPGPYWYITSYYRPRCTSTIKALRRRGLVEVTAWGVLHDDSEVDINAAGRAWLAENRKRGE